VKRESEERRGGGMREGRRGERGVEEMKRERKGRRGGGNEESEGRRQGRERKMGKS
jgi:hypothetical protein